MNFLYFERKLIFHLRIVLVIIKPICSSVKGPIGTYVAQGLGSSKVSCHRHEGTYMDLCYPRPKVIKDKPPYA